MSPLPRPGLKDISRGAKRSALPQKQLFTIGDVAKEFGVSLRALRFYEDRGLLSPFRDGSSRYYDDTQKTRLTMILKGKQLGFTLGEIHDFIAGGGTSSPGQLALKPEQVASQIKHLERQRAELESAIAELKSSYKKMVNGY